MLISFFHKNGVFSEAQNGFRKGKCIETAVQSFIERIQEALDKRILTIGIFIDLSKAYDVLNPLKTNVRLLYLKTQSVPRCKHFSSRL